MYKGMKCAKCGCIKRYLQRVNPMKEEPIYWCTECLIAKQEQIELLHILTKNKP